MEVVHDSPEILVFHEVVFPQELEEIKRLGKPFVSIKTVSITFDNDMIHLILPIAIQDLNY